MLKKPSGSAVRSPQKPIETLGEELSTDLGQHVGWKHYVAALAVLLVVIGIAYYYNALGRQRLEQADCIKRGVASFKQIGSYPTLRVPPDKGRAAIDVARERCSGTSAAF